MRKPKARDMKKAEKEAIGEVEKELMLIGDLAELSPAEVEDLDMDDYAVYQRKLKDFFS